MARAKSSYSLIISFKKTLSNQKLWIKIAGKKIIMREKICEEKLALVFPLMVYLYYGILFGKKNNL